MRKLERGDTIVEVLIAIAVSSMVLAITYSTMNRNLLITRDSQERSEATKIAQGQIELLKSHKDIGDVTINTGTFCLSDNSTTAHAAFSALAPSVTLPDDFTRYDALCRGISGLYNIAIVANAGLYQIYIRWDRIGGSSQDQIIMTYRV